MKQLLCTLNSRQTCETACAVKWYLGGGLLGDFLALLRCFLGALLDDLLASLDRNVGETKFNFDVKNDLFCRFLHWFC